MNKRQRKKAEKKWIEQNIGGHFSLEVIRRLVTYRHRNNRWIKRKKIQVLQDQINKAFAEIGDAQSVLAQNKIKVADEL